MQTTVAHIFERKCSNLFWSAARDVHGMLQVVLSADPSATGSADVHYLPAICIGSPEFCAWIRLKCVACKFCLVNETDKCHVHPSQLRIVLPETEPVLIPGLFASPRSTVVVGRRQVLTQLVLLHEQL